MKCTARRAGRIRENRVPKHETLRRTAHRATSDRRTGVRRRGQKETFRRGHTEPPVYRDRSAGSAKRSSGPSDCSGYGNVLHEDRAFRPRFDMRPFPWLALLQNPTLEEMALSAIVVCLGRYGRFLSVALTLECRRRCDVMEIAFIILTICSGCDITGESQIHSSNVSNSLGR
jgi:hypothetical protein